MAKIEIYTTPWCGYCARAKALLEKKGAYNVRRLLERLATADSIDTAFRETLSDS